jgi:hypothetical protein
VELHKLLDERQADAGSLQASSLCALHAVKALQNVRKFVCGNSTSGISHRQLDAISVLMEPDRNLAPQRELEGVGNEIEDDLFPLERVHVDRTGNRRAVDNKLEAGTFD